MASVFEEMMTLNRSLTESAHRNSTQKKESKVRKFKANKVRVESRSIFEEGEFDEYSAQFDVPEETAEGAEGTTEGTPDEVVLVVDPSISDDEEVPEDAAAEMVGDYVYKCPVCGSNYVCDCDADVVEGLDVDSTGAPLECPICGDDADQILIGEIAPADEAPGEETELEPQSVEDEEEVEEVPEDEDEFSEIEEESAKRGCSCVDEEFDETEVDTEFDDESTPDDDDDIEDLSLNVTSDDDEESADVVVKDSEVNLYVTEKYSKYSLDESTFNPYLTKFVRENYKNAKSLKVERAILSGKRLTLECKLTYKSGKSRKVSLKMENFVPSRKSVLSARDDGTFKVESKKSGKAPFMFKTSTVNNIIRCEGMKYDFITKSLKEGLKYRVSGTL